jgi:hypothetical protein
MDLVELIWCGVDWVGLVEAREKWTALMNAATNLQVP